jgi:nicotinamide-nucleotide amidase
MNANVEPGTGDLERQAAARVKAAILAVGSEMLTPLRIDTNSLYITEQLNLLGIDVVFKGVVGDDRGELATAVRAALSRVDLLVLSGGLGPTDDDVTREVVSEVLGRPMREDDAITARIRQRFASRGWTMPEINRRQAMVPEGARVLENPNGTAPGLWIDDSPRLVLLLPGPPRELKPMLRKLVEGPLLERAGAATLRRRIIRITGRTESHADEALQPLYAEWNRAEVPVAATILAALGQIELYLSAQASSPEVADVTLDRAVKQVEQLLGPDAYSSDGRTLEQVVGGLLADRGWKIAVAESCTGGLITSRLTDVPGSSRYVDRSLVTYSNEAKVELLGVPAEMIAEHGAVSEQVATAMAANVRASARVDVGVGVTGIAGPGGGTPEKPVGMVCVAAVTPGDSRVRTARFLGEREQIKFQASQAALDMVRRMMLLNRT